MRIVKRILAGFLAASVLFSSNMICFTAVAEGTNDTNIAMPGSNVTEGDFDLTVDIPEQWSNDINEWTITTDDADLFYKLSVDPINEDEWGSYTDDDIKKWNDDADFDEGEGYIKFWAVKQINGEEKFVTSEAVPYKYDKTSPDSFEIKKVKVEEKNEFVLKNKDLISDNLSGIEEVWYIINPEGVQTVEDIYTLGKNAEFDGESFEIPCTKEMNDCNVTVYLIDKAGNYASTYKDLTAPYLNVSGIDSNQWVNNLDGWNVGSDSYGANIYYKISDTDLEEWGDCPQSEEWKYSKDKVPEGHKFIHFWAAFEDQDRECAEITKEYKYDATAPNNFSIKYEQKGGHEDSNNVQQPPKFIVYGSGIFDETSGINQDRIYFKVKQHGNEWEQGTVEIKNQEVNDDGTISFTLDWSDADWLKDVNVTFYIVDNAGNETSCALNEKAVSYDSSPPVIITGKENLCITSSSDKNAMPLEPFTYGAEELENRWDSVYANDKCYLKITIQESDLHDIMVTVDNEKSVIFTADGKKDTLKWECFESDESNETKVYFLKLYDLRMSENEKHSLSVIAKDGQNSSAKAILTDLINDEEVEYTIFYDPEDDNDCKSNVEFLKANKINDKNYYGKGFEDEVNITLNDDNGIRGYTIEISGPEDFKEIVLTTDISSGKSTKVTYTTVVDASDSENTDVNKTVTYKMPYTEKTETIVVDNEKFNADGQYRISVEVEDLAGNTRTETYDFYVDTTPPSIIEENYTYNPSILNYLTFGIFGNNTVDIAIKVKDNDDGCGVDKYDVFLHWGKNEIKKISNEEDDTITFEFKGLPVGVDDIPYIFVTDLLDNTSNYYFKTEDGKISNIDNKTHLVLENIKPTSEIILPKENQHMINGEIWYPSDFDYSVLARDKESGLNRVLVNENVLNNDGSLLEEKPSIIEEGFTIDDEYINFEDMAERFTKEAKYQYHMEDEGNYHITVDAQDNAGNLASDTSDEADKRTKIVHVDKTNPEIIEFLFSDQNDSGADTERGTYGFYFVDDTKVKVFVKDEGNSSGINYVTLYRRDVNGQEKSVKIYSSDADYHSEDGMEYAEFTIEKGFKGQVWALVADNVVSENPFEDGFKHTSGLRFADGNIVEDAELHKSVSSITISENIQSNRSDLNGVPLYNTSIPLTINVQDTFSGISTIEWSIANDGNSGVITIANDGSYQSNSDMVSIVDDSISRDSNLITNLSFNIAVSSNTNDNEVYIKLTDRSGNESEAKKQYSIDTTNPTITASLSNQNPINKIYYNTDQVVTVSITERNFNASDVRFMLNGSEQIISNWVSTGEGDETVHIGTFTISADGDYSYSINFTDMAGNAAEPFSQSMFVIDKTAPVLKTNFDEFKTSKEEHYFGRDSINKTAKITIIEHNFSAAEANVEIFRLEPGSEHDISGVKSTPVSGWSDNGDEHTLEIPFKENDDGVYLIRVTPVDLASNSAIAQETVVFEIDFTNPIIAERNGVYTKDEEKSYENLEIYNEQTSIEEDFIPSVAFSDTNFYHIEYDLTVYTPEYSNGKEIGAIVPETDSGTISDKLYALPEFKKDGVYSVDLTAVDKAGNRSVLCRNTSVLMMKSDVLAYISNSNKAESKGWYSLQKDENTPISKRPDAFSDLNITVFAQKNSKTSIILRDENGESQDTGITADNSEDMYAVGVYNYTLPKEYFVDNYPEGTNKDLYLWAENTYNKETSHITLGWIRIDALAPTCTVPSDLKNWKSYTSKTKTITLTNISESLDKSQCVVYDNGKVISAAHFDYSDETDTLSYTLEKGWHDLSFVLVDEAGNTYTVQEISSIQVGLFYCLWFRILCSIFTVSVIEGVVIIIVKKKKSVNK